MSTLLPAMHRLRRGAGDRTAASLLAGGRGRGEQAACCFPHQPEDGFVCNTLDLWVPPAGFRKCECVLSSVKRVSVSTDSTVFGCLATDGDAIELCQDSPRLHKPVPSVGRDTKVQL